MISFSCVYVLATCVIVKSILHISQSVLGLAFCDLLNHDMNTLGKNPEPS